MSGPLSMPLAKFFSFALAARLRDWAGRSNRQHSTTLQRAGRGRRMTTPLRIAR